MPRSEHRLAKWLLLNGLAVAVLPTWATPPTASQPQSQRIPPLLPIDTQQETNLLKLTGREFRIRRTAHFVIAFNSDPTVVSEFISRVEQTYAAVYRFCDTNKIVADRPPHRLEVVFFDEPQQYLWFCQQSTYNATGTFGSYYEPTNRSAFFNVNHEPRLVELGMQIAAAQVNLGSMRRETKRLMDPQARLDVQFGDGRRTTMTADQVRRQIAQSQRELEQLDNRRKAYSERINCTVVQHEIAHQVLFNAGLHQRKASNPRWLVEGLATLFETPPTLQGSGIAVINPLRLKDFRDAVADGRNPATLGADHYLHAVATGRLVSPQQLILQPELLNTHGDNGANNYAVTWALTYYLLRTKRTDFSVYLQELSHRQPGMTVSPAQELELFEKHFGPLDEVFSRRFATATLRLSYRVPVDGF